MFQMPDGAKLRNSYEEVPVVDELDFESNPPLAATAATTIAPVMSNVGRRPIPNRSACFVPAGFPAGSGAVVAAFSASTGEVRSAAQSATVLSLRNMPNAPELRRQFHHNFLQTTMPSA